MLASRGRENPSRGHDRDRRQHRPSPVLRDRVGPGDPAARAGDRLLGLVRGGLAGPRRRRRPALRPACRARAAPEPAPGGHGHQPPVHHAADHRVARPSVHRAGPGHRVPGVVGDRAAAPGSRRLGGNPCRAVACGHRTPGAARHAADGTGGGRHLRIPPARPDRWDRRPWPRGRLRGVAEGPIGVRGLLAGPGIRRNQAPPRGRARRLAPRPA